MFEPFYGLCRAGKPAGTTTHGLIFFSNSMSPAHRASMRKDKFLRFDRTFFQDHADNLRNHVSGALDNHRIADTNIFALNFIFIVKSGVRDDNAADIYGFQIGNRRECSGTSDLNANIVDFGKSLFGGKFMSNRPTWRARQKTEPIL